LFRPDEIERRTFHRSAVGYNRDEVRAFLRLVASDFTAYQEREFIDPAALLALQRQTLADMRAQHLGTVADQQDVQERLAGVTEHLVQVIRRLESAVSNLHGDTRRTHPTPPPAASTPAVASEWDSTSPGAVSASPRADVPGNAPRAYYRLEPTVTPGSTRHSRPLKWADASSGPN
jgi:DivIVA domain-containing protein